MKTYYKPLPRKMLYSDMCLQHGCYLNHFSLTITESKVWIIHSYWWAIRGCHWRPLTYWDLGRCGLDYDVSIGWRQRWGGLVWDVKGRRWRRLMYWDIGRGALE